MIAVVPHTLEALSLLPVPYDEQLFAAIRRHSGLTALKLYLSRRNGGDACLETLVTSLPQLRALALDGHSRVTSEKPWILPSLMYAPLPSHAAFVRL